MPFTFTQDREDGLARRPADVGDRRSELERGRRDPARERRTLRVIEFKPGRKPDGDPVLVVESA